MFPFLEFLLKHQDPVVIYKIIKVHAEVLVDHLRDLFGMRVECRSQVRHFLFTSRLRSGQLFRLSLLLRKQCGLQQGIGVTADGDIIKQQGKTKAGWQSTIKTRRESVASSGT